MSVVTRGMTVNRRFTEPGQNPFDGVEWEVRHAKIGHGDRVSFEQKDVEFPASWSQNATNIVAQKYFRGPLDSPERERSVRQMIARVAGTIAEWGRERGYFATNEDGDAFEAELTYILLHQMAAFNSPVWFNVGWHPVGDPKLQASACFILSVQDDMESILEWNTKEGRIFRGGSGSGINLSAIRGSMEPLSRGGTGSGPCSFMRGADSWAGSIKSGGGTRRAAKMVILNVDHPDIREFIWCKAKEEDKAQALRDAGFDMSIDGDGFHSIQYQNANNSVRLTDEFMQAVQNDGDWHLIGRVSGEPIGEPMKAQDLMREIAEAAHRCADPGVQFDSVINRWHTCPNSGRINASNPCSEYMHVDDSACNLASLNLMKFRRSDGTFDVRAFEHAVDILITAMDITIGTHDQPASSFPTEEITRNARDFRQLGLGYANLGAYLMSNGMPYDSDEGRATAAAITALTTGRAYSQSARMAERVGPYARYAENREAHNEVMRMHRDEAYSIPDAALREGAGGPVRDTSEWEIDLRLLDAARDAWDDAVQLGKEHGYRNAQATVLAPTGTISFLMDCDTTGVEPDFSLVKYKELVGGGQMTIVNQTVPLALATLGYSEAEIGGYETDDDGKHSKRTGIVGFIDEHGTIIGAPGLKNEHLPVFDVAVGERAISHMGHIRMMGAVQPFISGAISKTVNLPETATVADIEDAYLQAWHLGVKALAIYRDGSKTAQALRTDAQKDAPSPDLQKKIDQAVKEALAMAPPRRRHLPRERKSITHKFSIGGHEGYITAGMYEDGTVGEIFLTDIGKEGSTLRGMMNAYATAISISLQYGVPLEKLVEKFSYMRFEPEGMTDNAEIPFAKSMPDYIMRFLASRFLDAETQAELGIKTPEAEAHKARQEAIQRGEQPLFDSEKPPVQDLPTARSNGNGSASAVAVAEPAVVAAVERRAGVRGMDGPACQQCGAIMQRTGSCYTCSSCGFNTGCG